jgi:branched-chain amino acid transport system ATP-binding protein
MEELKVDRLSKDFGAIRVLRNISFSVSSEERRIVIIGPNGAGKTTLFNLISGELPSSGGSIHLYGRNVTTMPCYRRTRLGLARTFQVSDLFPHFTLMENVLLALQAHDPCCYQMLRSRRAYTHLYEKAEDLLKAMRLHEKKDYPIASLSHGETRLTEIILGIAAKPQILLLDEPTSGLTSSEGVWLAKLIREILKDITILMIEHDMNIAFDFADRMIVLHQGEIMADGRPEEIRANPKIREIYLGTFYG